MTLCKFCSKNVVFQIQPQPISSALLQQFFVINYIFLKTLLKNVRHILTHVLVFIIRYLLLVNTLFVKYKWICMSSIKEIQLKCQTSRRTGKTMCRKTDIIQVSWYWRYRFFFILVCVSWNYYNKSCMIAVMGIPNLCYFLRRRMIFCFYISSAPFQSILYWKNTTLRQGGLFCRSARGRGFENSSSVHLLSVHNFFPSRERKNYSFSLKPLKDKGLPQICSSNLF